MGEWTKGTLACFDDCGVCKYHHTCNAVRAQYIKQELNWEIPPKCPRGGEEDQDVDICLLRGPGTLPAWAVTIRRRTL